jgi:hypothetical protein
MTAALLLDRTRKELMEAALAVGTMAWRGSRMVCVTCGRSGYRMGSWADACLKNGHPYACPCGRRFSTKGGLSAHRIQRRTGKQCNISSKG